MNSKKDPWIFALMLALGFASAGRCQSPSQQPTQDQQAAPSQNNGPAAQPGETVLVPKKKDAQPAPAPEEKKPERINPKEVFTISTTTNLVNVDVLVTDKDGSPISTLAKTNFKVYDDGVEQNLSNFGTAAAPITVCLLIEFSSRSWSNLYLALQDSYQFLGFIQPQDWVAVVEYDMKTNIVSDFTQDRGQVRAALDTLRIPGFSEANLFDALSYTIDRMRDIQGRKAIIAIVGGSGNSLLGTTGIDTFSKITYEQMLKIAKGSDTPIYPLSTYEFIAVRNPSGRADFTNDQIRNQLNYIAQYSGGQAYFPRFEGEIPSDYQQIAQQLRTQYSLGFVPSDSAKDGKYHKLKVELIDTDGSPLRIINQKGKQVKYRVNARDGYYAPKS
ncbi:MAG TPA: VWA domain-containing protein [Terriglobia bacterium]|jgi:VWFA-related protein|nr:VWA domain-containing protein [Terriglobia bacterium]